MPFAHGEQKKKDYDRGWNASKRFSSDMTGRMKPPLETADMKGEPRAWYLGYEDYASDYPKYKRLDEV